MTYVLPQVPDCYRKCLSDVLTTPALRRPE